MPTFVTISLRTRISQLNYDYICEKVQLNGENMPASAGDWVAISCVVLETFHPLSNKDRNFAII